jgi:hypothetical protein
MPSGNSVLKELEPTDEVPEYLKRALVFECSYSFYRAFFKCTGRKSVLDRHGMTCPFRDVTIASTHFTLSYEQPPQYF